MRLTFHFVQRGIKEACKFAPPSEIAPFFLGSTSLLEEYDKWIVDTWEEVIIHNIVVSPTIDGSGNIVARFFLEVFSTIGQVENLKSILLEDHTNTVRLDPQKGTQCQMEGSSSYSNLSCVPLKKPDKEGGRR